MHKNRSAGQFIEPEARSVSRHFGLILGLALLVLRLIVAVGISAGGGDL